MNKNINSEIIFETPLVKGMKAKSKKLNLLIKLNFKNNDEILKRQPLNITYVIDNSGSMNGLLQMNDFLDNRLLDLNNTKVSSNKDLPINTGSNIFNPYQTTPFTPQDPVVPRNIWENSSNRVITNHYIPKNQLMLVKEAVINSLNYLKEEDTISIVSFNSQSKILAEGLSIKDKDKIINIVNSLTAGGSTNLLAGWKDGVKCITNNLKKDSLNRIIVLTDGQVDRTGNDNIPQAVAKIKDVGISTTTFGVGLHYNEDLLMSIAEHGDGNYYYIKETKDFLNLFTDEFENLNKIVAKNVQIQVEDEEIILLNNFKLKEGRYRLPNLIKGKNTELLFSLSLKLDKSTVEALTSKKITIIYQDRDSNECKENIIIKIPVVDKKEKFTNKEVKEKIILNEVAQNKNKIAESLDNNDFEKVSELLKQSKMFASNLSGQLQASTLNALATLENSMESKDYNALRKTSLYDSYNIMRGKDR